MHQRNAWDHAVEEAQRFFDRVIAPRAGCAEPARRAARLVPHAEQRSRGGHVRDAGAESDRAAANVTAVDRQRSRRDARRGRRRRRSATSAPPWARTPARAPNGGASPPKRATPSAATSKPRICSASASRSCTWRWRGRKTIRCSACTGRSARVAHGGRRSDASGEADTVGLPIARRAAAAEARGRSVGGDAERGGADRATRARSPRRPARRRRISASTATCTSGRSCCIRPTR